MDIKKLAPWNWFKKEEEERGGNVPSKRGEVKGAAWQEGMVDPITQLHRQLDRLFADVFRGHGLSPFPSEFSTPLSACGVLRPDVDIGVTDQEYSITVEVPGVSENDVHVEVVNHTLTIRGEKRQQREEQEKDYYRVERSYGSFQRVLSLPEDAVQEEIKASFKHGVLTIGMPRKALPKSTVKHIEIKNG